MQKRKLGQQGLEVSALGLGCMGLSFAYGTAASEEQSMKVLHRALDLGMNFWDTAELYGPYTNEELICRALKDRSRQKVIIATKFGFKLNAKGEIIGLISTPDHIKKTVDESLKRLGTDYIDLYYQHRLDPDTPIEDTMGSLADLVKAGKVRYIGLSEVGPGIIRRAHAVHPLTAIQSEYSLWDRVVEAKVLPLVRELNIGFVPFSPIGRGFLSGKINSLNDLEQSDFRQRLPRFQGENFKHNIKLVEAVKKIASTYQATPAQIALAWLLHQGDDIVPIPGTRRIDYLEENAHSLDLHLPESVWTTINELINSFDFAGVRYPEEILKMTDNSD